MATVSGAGRRFSAITSLTASRRSTSLPCRRSHSKFCIVLSLCATDDDFGCRLAVTANPTAEWISRQAHRGVPVTPRAAISHSGSRHLVRSSLLAADPCKGHSGPSRSHPVRPGKMLTLRLIGSIRRECLDHMIVFGEAHLRRILRGYAAYYNVSRTHRSLNKDAPLHRAIERLGAVVSRPVLGGLHHQYCRI